MKYFDVNLPFSQYGEEKSMIRIVRGPDIDVTAATKDLLTVKTILDRLKVPFFLLSGTCLGAIRDKRIIPWDHDLDLGIIAEDFHWEILEQLKRSGFSCAIFSGVSLSTKRRIISFLSFRCPTNRFLFLNIDVFYLRGNYRISAIWKPIVLPLFLFDKLKTISFLGKTFCTLNPPETYLELAYGADWHTPKRELPGARAPRFYRRHIRDFRLNSGFIPFISTRDAQQKMNKRAQILLG